MDIRGAPYDLILVLAMLDDGSSSFDSQLGRQITVRTSQMHCVLCPTGSLFVFVLLILMSRVYPNCLPGMLFKIRGQTNNHWTLANT